MRRPQSLTKSLRNIFASPSAFTKLRRHGRNARRQQLPAESLEARIVLAAPVAVDDSFSIDEDSVLSVPASVPTVPIHRYSFDGTGGNGATLADSIGGADGMLREADGVSRLENGQMILGGGSSATAGFGNLPNGLVSGLTDVTFEGWVTVNGSQNWQRIFSFGSTTTGEHNDVGGAGNGNDVFFLSANRGGNVNEQQVEWKDDDPGPDGSQTGVRANIQGADTTTFGQEFYFSVVYDADGNAGSPQIRYYREVGGVPQLRGTANTPFDISELNDINNWLGRSQWLGDGNLQGSFNEFRIYDQALSDTEVGDSFNAGPNAPLPILQNDSDADGDPLSVVAASVVNTPAGGPFVATSVEGATVTIAANGALTYDPTNAASLQALNDGESLIDTFTYTITDGQGESDIATVSVTVSGISTAPLAIDDDAMVDADQVLDMVDDGSGGLTASLLANDIDEDGTLTVSTSSTVSDKGAAVVVSSDGTFTYDPTGVQQFAELPAGQTATDTFTYSITDGTSASPIHRYSFDGSGGDGAVLVDSVSGADGTLEEADGVSRLENGQMILGGGSSATAGFGNLPNGLISGLTDVTFEGWLTVDAIQNWQRIYSFGSSTGGEFNQPGGSGGGNDVFMYAANRGTGANTQRNEVRDADPAPTGTATGIQQNIDNNDPTVLGQEFYFAVVYDADGNNGSPQLSYYREIGGVPQVRNVLNTDLQLSDINDINNWLGRSQWTGDANLQGSFNEFRIYDKPLSVAQIDQNFSAGPDGAFNNAATVNITINGVNDAPVAGDDAGYITDENSTLSIPAATATPQAGTPIHRYSFDGSGGDGAPLHDSVGGAHGTLIEADGVSRLENGELVLGGGSSNSAGYGDLPNGLISGLNDVTFEGWVTIDGSQGWQRIFDFGSSQPGGADEVTDVGDTNGNGNQGLDYFFLSANRGGNVNDQRVEIRDVEDAPDGSTNNVNAFGDASDVTTFGQQFYFAVSYDADGNGGTPQISYYREIGGVPTLRSTVNTNITLGDINDINNWLGRSNWMGDANLQGSFNEFRIYDRPLSATDINNNFAAGPDALTPILANDFDVDTGSTFAVTAVQGIDIPGGGPFVGTSDRGAKVTLGANGQVDYDPQQSMELQALLDGESLTDTFTYTITDDLGATDTASVSVVVTGSTEVEDDFFSTDEDTPLANNDIDQQATPADFTDDGVLANDPFGNPQVAEINGNAANVGTPVSLPSGADLTVNPDGSFSYDPGTAFNSLLEDQPATDTFTYTVVDQPIHRYSFDGTGGDGATLVDSIGGADGTLIAPNNDSQLQNGQLTLGGGSSNTAGYGDLPNGLISGLTDVTFEGWVTITGSQNWQRIFDFGSSQPGGSDEITGVGDTNGNGDQGLDYFILTANRGGNVNQQRVEFRDVEDAPDGSTNNGNAVIDANDTTTFGQEFYFAVTYDADGNNGSPQIRYYRDIGGVPMLRGTVNTNITLGDINDINNWLGRSNWLGDANMQGSFNEFRIYDRPLNDTEVDQSFAAGPDTLGTTSDANVTINLVGVNDVPTGVDDAVTAPEDGPAITIDVLANDTDPDAGDTKSIVSFDDTGVMGTVTNNGTDFSYDPNGQFESLAVGEMATETFAYTMQDSAGAESSATVTVTVNGANDAPVSQDAMVTTDEDNSVSAAFDANDIDSDDDPGSLIYTITSNPAEGSVVNNNDGTFTFDPGSDFQDLAVGASRVVSFDYTATDSNSAVSNTSSVEVTVTGLNDAPTLTVVDSTVTVDEGQLAGNSGTFSDIDAGSSVTITASAGTITQDSGNSGNWGWSINTADGPSDSQTITITATDDQGETATIMFDLTVDNVPPVASFVTTQTEAALDVPVPFTFAATDVSSADQAADFTFTIDWGDGTATETIDGMSPVMTTHSFQNFGEVTITLTATDKDGGLSDPVQQTITIVPVAVVGDDLVATGTPASDRIIFYTTGLGVRVRYNNEFYPLDGSTYSFNGQMVANGRGGSDYIVVNQSMPIEARFDGGDGNDYLAGGTADDTLIGGAGNDVILAGEGDNFLDGGNDNDRLEGRSGADIIFGGMGNDRLNGGAGNDILNGGADNDFVYGGLGDDLLVGGLGIDTLQGHYGNDVIFGGDDSDQVFGGGGNDLAVGGTGGDRVRGDSGDDVIVGGASDLEAQLDTDLDALLASTGSTGLSATVQAAVDAWFSAQSDTSRMLFEAFSEDSAIDDLTGGSGVDTFHAGANDRVRNFASGETLL